MFNQVKHLLQFCSPFRLLLEHHIYLAYLDYFVKYFFFVFIKNGPTGAVVRASPSYNVAQ